jgi:phage regulator Rha-like protein
MTEDEAFDELEQRLKQQAQAKETENLTLASIAAAEFISTQTADLLAITTLRKAFEYGYRTGWRDASKENK